MRLFDLLDLLPRRIAAALVKHPWAVLLVLLGLTAFSAWFALRLRFDFTPQAIFKGGDQLVAYAEQFKQEFGYEDAVIIVGFEATGEQDVLSPVALTWQAQMVKACESLPEVKRVESLISMKRPRVTLSLSPKVSYEPIVDEIPVSQEVSDRLRKSLEKSDLPFGSLINRDLKMAGLLVVFDPANRSFADMQRMVRLVQDEIEERPPPPGFRLHVSGLPNLRVDIVENLQRDQLRLMPLAMLLYFLMLVFTFRTLSGSLLPLFAVGMGMVWTLGLAGYWNEPLNIVSNILPVMLLISGIGNTVHISARYAEEGHRIPDRREATRRTMTQLIPACLGAFATMSIGFYSLRAAQNQILQAFGSLAGCGLILIYLAVILTHGSLLPFLKPPEFQEEGGISLAISQRIARAGDWVVRNPWKVVLAFASIAAIAGWNSRSIEVNSTTIETYDEHHPTIQTLRQLENKLSGLLPLEISIQADNPDRLYEPEVVRKVAELRQFGMDQPPILFSRTYIDFLNEINLRFVPLDELRNELPRVDAEGKRRIDRARRFVRRVAEQMRYHDFMSPDHTRARLLFKLRDVGTRDTLQLIATLEAKMQELFPPGSGIETRVTGDAYVNAKALTNMIRELMASILTASLIIFGIILVLFRSWRVALMTMPPNLIPLVITLGYMGLKGFDMNAGNVIVFTISLGIGVDNTIHYILRFREEFRRDPDVARATHKALLGKSQPMILSTFHIVVGLAVLLLSDFVPTRRFAELTIVTMVSALIGALFLLPACVKLLWKAPRVGEPAEGG